MILLIESWWCWPLANHTHAGATITRVVDKWSQQAAIFYRSITIHGVVSIIIEVCNYSYYIY